jgi:hypothetical protein
MSERPMFDATGPDNATDKAAANFQRTSQSRMDTPLAVELPVWDLVPPETLLVRRRPLKK